MKRPPESRNVLPIPDPIRENGVPVEALLPPAGAPNVVVVVIDDMGFGASSPFGGPCLMPTAQRLADEGLRYSRFHVTALCSPTRQALLTGRNHHSVGMGGTTEMATSSPGYNGYRPSSAATTAQILGGNGYSTAAFGKWHQTPAREVSLSGPFDRWPTGEGFDEFYGFMGAEMNHWYPQLFHGTTPVVPEQRPEDGYHLSEDLTDHAITWIRTQNALTPDKPFYTYLAFGATHAPHHVAPEWIDKYRGQFDGGWDVQREQTLARQKRLGLVPDDAELGPWAEGVPAWDELDDEAKAVAARFMETYAGFAEHTDAQVSRLIDELERLGQLDNTLIVYLLGDNGASGEGGIEGTLHEHLVGHGIPDSTSDMAEKIDSFGDATTYSIYPVGWALAMNAPYQWTKQVASHFGGTRDGMILRWGDQITGSAAGTVRHQFHHVIDILPTILEATGLPQPTSVNGVEQSPIEGTSMMYTFTDAEAPDQRTTQYFEMCGNRGIYHEGWMAVTRHGTPWLMLPDGLPAFEDDVWELYDTSVDWTQAHDLAADLPEKLEELKAVFVTEATKYKVFPLDDRVTERENPFLAGRIDLLAGKESMTYSAGMGRFTEETTMNTKNRSHTLTASVVVPEPQADTVSGVLIAQGGRFGGWSLYCLDGVLTYSYNTYGTYKFTVRGETTLAAGAHELQMRFDYDGGGLGRGATITLLDGESVIGSGRVDRTTAYYFSFDETLNIGVDLGTPVTDDYLPMDNGFTGEINFVRIDVLEDAVTGTEEDVARHVMAHQ
ncbi:arylsulfatase [Cryobacterium melibiosiphilum]|uniref:Arylsulfatase n=1 Tax=Cryobacterium melibiosiphilum TaxID=995039 RepID=A0A3A5MFT6_9MICO|nr:arylsulfatase [Cryobacterium melibiosiphilum]RJT86839.1 arylsulfatase [Cryobacterium melibiosiphilum]